MIITNAKTNSTSMALKIIVIVFSDTLRRTPGVVLCTDSVAVLQVQGVFSVIDESGVLMQLVEWIVCAVSVAEAEAAVLCVVLISVVFIRVVRMVDV